MAAIAPAGPTPAKENNTPSVPLECILCPKKSVFSDSSHLLTHISSKSHLHQKFSIEFRSKSDPAAKEQLDQFDAWYAELEIERLMAERLAAQSTRKPVKRNRNRTAAKQVRKSTSALDAMRAAQLVSQLGSGTQTPDNLPRLAHWNTAPAGSAMDYNPNFYHSPLSMRQRSAYPLPALSSLPSLHDDVGGDGFVLKHSPFMADLDGSNITAPPSEIDSSFGIGFVEEDSPSSRLKGVIWPGMDLFDSATPDQKKMRNQRKGTSAIDHLKLTSQAITATETVWGPEGDVRKERDIYATPSEDGSSPSTPPRKRKQRGRNGVSSESTPLSVMRCEDGQNCQPTTKRIGRLNGIDMSKMRQTRTSSRTAAKGSKKNKTGETDQDETDAEEPSYTLASAKPKDSFDVYYEDGNAIDGLPQVSRVDRSSGGSLGPVALDTRPALHQLDPNLSTSEPSPYFKNSSSSRFYDHENDSGHMAFRSHASPYGSFSGSSLSNIASQPRSSSIYPPFDSQMFGGMSNADTTTASYHGPSARRMGFGSFAMDPSSFSYGSDQRDGSIRDPSFTDPAFPSTSRLFEL
ncbi:hypothetical protein F503_04746 [Ophiostoma piceae UAMH 11346]|uniref:Uncharacterized protein n=1 Tax=Ophiostoma piceae (strain UAMH 11346) TaxID=1262450 RepID=S3BXS7_OPHP1|nr:hypothetical protein F503_04746 [Ophiostoma piceae UAMH 11346]